MVACRDFYGLLFTIFFSVSQPFWLLCKAHNIKPREKGLILPLHEELVTDYSHTQSLAKSKKSSWIILCALSQFSLVWISFMFTVNILEAMCSWSILYFLKWEKWCAVTSLREVVGLWKRIEFPPFTTYCIALDRQEGDHPSSQCLLEIDKWEWNIDLSPMAEQGLWFGLFGFGFGLVNVLKLPAVVSCLAGPQNHLQKRPGHYRPPEL